MNKIIVSKVLFQIFPNPISNFHVLSTLSWWYFLNHFQFLVVQSGSCPSRRAPGLGLHHSVAWLDLKSLSKS